MHWTETWLALLPGAQMVPDRDWIMGSSLAELTAANREQPIVQGSFQKPQLYL